MAEPTFSKAEIEELRSLIKLLQKDIDGVEFDNLIKSGKAAKDYLRTLREEASAFAGEISEAVEGFQRIINEIKNTNNGVNRTTNAFRSLSSIAEKVQYHQKGISELTEKDVKKLQEKQKQTKVSLGNISKQLEIEKQSLLNEKQIAEEKKRRLAAIVGKTIDERREQFRVKQELAKINKQLIENESAHGNILGVIKEQDTYYNQLESDLAKINTELNQQKELLGLGGAAIGGMQTALDKLGFGGLAEKLGLDEAKEKMKETADSIIAANDDTGSLSNKFKVLRAGLGSMGKSLLANLKDPISITVLLVTQILEAFATLDDSIGKLAKNFGISYKEAASVSNSLNDAANASYLLNVTTQGLTDAFIELNNEYGTFAKINEEALVSFTRLTKEAGVTNEAAKSLFETTILTGKEVEASTSEFLGQAAALSATNGLALNQKQLLEGIQHISKATLLTLGGQPEALAEAVVNAKMLGVSLEQVEQIAGSLLEFESSITAELEAELLLGKNINLEKARLAALNGDIATVAEEIAKQTGSAADFTKMNVIQQEALAKSVGMTREDLAKSLMEREALVKLSGEEGKTAQERFNNLVKEVGLEEAKKRLGDDNLANLYAGQNVQERFTAAIEKLKEVFISLAEPLMPVLDAFAGILEIVGPIAGVLGQMVKFTMQLGKYILPVIAAYKTFQFVSGTILGIQAAIGKEQAIQKVLMDQNLVRVRAYKMVTWATNLIEKAKNLELLKSLGLKRSNLALSSSENAKTMVGAVAGIIKGAWTSLGPIPFIGAALAAAAVGTGIAYLLSQSSKAKSAGDIMSPANGKTQISTKEGGLFELSKNDDVIAAPGLLSGNNKGTSSASPMINIQPMIDRLAAVENVLVQILNKETNVYMDSTKVGTALNVGTVRIQ
jgi:hypothetical protein